MYIIVKILKFNNSKQEYYAIHEEKLADSKNKPSMIYI